MLFQQGDHQLRQHVLPGGSSAGDSEAAGDGSRDRRHGLLESDGAVGQVPGERYQRLARFGECDASPGAEKQVGAQHLLERSDLHADGRLRDTETSPGLGEILRLGGDQEYAKFGNHQHKQPQRIRCLGPLDRLSIILCLHYHLN